MDDLYWPDLAYQGTQRGHTLVVSKLTNKELQSGYVEEGDAKLIAEALYREDVFGLICLFFAYVGTFGDHIADFAFHTLVLRWDSISFHPLFHHPWSLCLLYHGYFVPVIHHHREVLVECFLRKADV